MLIAGSVWNLIHALEMDTGYCYEHNYPRNFGSRKPDGNFRSNCLLLSCAERLSDN